MQAIAVSDLHGNSRLYELLLRVADAWRVSSVFITGDLLPGENALGLSERHEEADLPAAQERFIRHELAPMLESFLASHRHTDVYAIMGNDDCRIHETLLFEFDSATRGFHLVDGRLIELQDARQMRAFFPSEVPSLLVTGYPYVPPGAGLLMDWVKYENEARLRPPGMDACIDVHETGIQTVNVDSSMTIADDLADYASYLLREGDGGGFEYAPRRTIHLFHSPPYGTPLDGVPPQGRYDFLKLPDHVGSSEIARFIERAQPHLALCGHCHEAVVLGSYRTQIGDTWCINPGSQTHIDVLSVVQFDVYQPSEMKQLFINAR